jgi:hypothetical protein
MSAPTYQIGRCRTTQTRNPISYPRQDVIPFWVKSLFIMPNICTWSFRLSIAVTGACPGDVASCGCGQFLTNIVPVSRISTSRLLHRTPVKHTSSVRKQFPLVFAVCIIALSWRSLFSQTSYCPYNLCHTQPTYGTVVPWDQTVDLCVFQDVIWQPGLQNACSKPKSHQPVLVML